MQKIKKNNLIFLIALAAFTIVAFFYRLYGLIANYSFWTDEEHVAIFARNILEKGKPVLLNNYSTGFYQWLQYWLAAFSARIFGLNEFAIRFPSIVFGVLTIWAVYFLGKELFNKRVALLASFFITFLKIEILWSRQARPYQALQFFFILGAYFLYKIVKAKKINRNYFLGFLICGILASLMHGLGIFLFVGGLFYLLIMKLSWLKERCFLGLLAILALTISSYFLKDKIVSTLDKFTEFNNFYYYRVFLKHNYLLISFLFFLGLLVMLLKGKFKQIALFAIFVGIQFALVSWFLPQPFTRYFYIIFPFIILPASYFLWFVSKFFKNKFLSLICLLFLVFLTVWISKDKFAILPQRIYSLNEDMQEIPEVDWKVIYGFVENKLNQDENIVLVTNWTDLPVWFLGEGKLNYLIRKDYMAQTDSFTNAEVIHDLTELKEMIKEEKSGLLVLDSWDDYVPDGVREYAAGNLKKELEVDRLYPKQPRLWPVQIYSWGI